MRRREGCERKIVECESVKQIRMECDLNTASAPVDAAGAVCLLVRGSSNDGLGLRTHGTKHDATGEDSGLAAIVVGHLRLGSVDEDARLASAFTAGELVCGLLAADGGVGRVGV